MQTAPHILLLEDDSELLETMTELLEEQGYRVTPVGSGVEAVKLAAKHPFDLMIADIRMSGMGGLEAVERTQRCQSEIATLFVSGYATPENVARAEELQAGTILTKPFAGQDFLDRVSTLLRGRQKQKAQSIRRQQQSRSLTWSLETLAWAIDLPPTDIPARKFRDLATQMALELGFQDAVAREIGLAAALASIDGLIQIPEDFLSDRSSLSSLRFCLSTYQDLDSTREGQLVAFVLAKLRVDNETLAELKRLAPDIEVAYEAIHRRASKTPLELLELTIQEPSSLISLGRSFERMGDLEAARQAYRQAQSEETPWEATQGFLEEARVELALGKGQEVVVLCKEAARLTSSLGPQNRALTLFRCGTLSFQAGMNSTRLLQKALELLRPLRFEGTTSLAYLALTAQSQNQNSASEIVDCLKVLASPRYVAEVGDSGGWLVPALLKFVAEIEEWEFAASVLRFLRNMPQETSRYVAGPSALNTSKIRLLEALEKDTKLQAPTGFLQALRNDGDPEVAHRANLLLTQEDDSGEALTVRCNFLGSFEVYCGCELIPEKKWRTKKVKYLFAYLAHKWGTRFSPDSVCELFWPDKQPEKSRQSFYWYNSMIRKCLAGDEPALKEILQRNDDTVNLNPDISYWRDIDDFEQCFRAGRSAHENGSYEKAHQLLSQLISIYRGPFLQGYNGEWAESQREHFALMYERALSLCCDSTFQLDRLAEAEELALKLLGFDSANEKASEILMRCFLKRGHPTRAILEYDRCREALGREFGLEPGDALEEVYQLALSGH